MFKYENHTLTDDNGTHLNSIEAINELYQHAIACYRNNEISEKEFYNKRKDIVWAYCIAVQSVKGAQLKKVATLFEECIEKTDHAIVAGFFAAILYSTYMCMIRRGLSDDAFDAFMKLKGHYMAMYMNESTHEKGRVVGRFFVLSSNNFPEYDIQGVPYFSLHSFPTKSQHLEEVKLSHLEKNTDHICKLDEDSPDEEYLEREMDSAAHFYAIRMRKLKLSPEKKAFYDRYTSLMSEFNLLMAVTDKFNIRENTIKLEEILEKCLEEDTSGYGTLFDPITAYNIAIFLENKKLKDEIKASIVTGRKTDGLCTILDKLKSTRRRRKAVIPLIYPVITIAVMAIVLTILGLVTGKNILGAVLTKSIPYTLKHPIIGGLFIILPLHLAYKFISAFVRPWEYREPAIPTPPVYRSRPRRRHHAYSPARRHQTFSTDYIDGFDKYYYTGLPMTDSDIFDIDAVVQDKWTSERLENMRF